MPRTPAGEVASIQTRNKQASAAQISYLKSLINGREWAQHPKLADKIGNDRIDFADLRTHEASDLIVQLKECPFKQRQATVTAEDVGIYMMEDTKGVYIARIMLSRGGFPYGSRYEGHGQWNYLTGLAAKIKRNGQRLTGDELAAAAIEFQFCRRCGLELTDPVSQERGIGPICAGKE